MTPADKKPANPAQTTEAMVERAWRALVSDNPTNITITKADLSRAVKAALIAIEEQAGWREPDRWRAKFNLWFFRELSDEQRLKLFSLHGLPVDEIGLVHGFQRKALDCCLPVSPKQETE